MSVSDVSWFKDGLFQRAVMRKYARFSIPFSIRIPAHPFKSHLRALSKRKKKNSLPTDKHSFNFLPVTHCFEKWQLSCPPILFAFILLRQKRVFCWFLSFTPYLFYGFFSFTCYVTCLRLCISTALCILFLELLQGTRHSTTHLLS